MILALLKKLWWVGFLKGNFVKFKPNVRKIVNFKLFSSIWKSVYNIYFTIELYHQGIVHTLAGGTSHINMYQSIYLGL